MSSIGLHEIKTFSSSLFLDCGNLKAFNSRKVSWLHFHFHLLILLNRYVKSISKLQEVAKTTKNDKAAGSPRKNEVVIHELFLLQSFLDFRPIAFLFEI